MVMFLSTHRVFFYFFALCSLQTISGGDGPRASLMTRIVLRYSAFLPPNPSSEPLHIGQALSVKHIGQVNEKEGTVRVHFWLHQNWTDGNLMWDRAEYNISTIYLLRRILWVPDTTVRNGIINEDNRSRDLLVSEIGEVKDAGYMEVTIPCTKQQASGEEDGVTSESFDETDNAVHGKLAMTCSLMLGAWVESAADIVFEPGPVDTSGLQHTATTLWKLRRVRSYSSLYHSVIYDEPSSVNVFEFTLVMNIANFTPLQLIAPSVVTALAACTAFFLPPLAGERILLVGVALLGQVVLSGLSVVAQIEAHEDSTMLFNFMIFSTVYTFLIVMAVLVSFFVIPLLKKFETSRQQDTGEEDGDKLLFVGEKKLSSMIPSIIMFVLFILLYTIGMATIFA